MKALHQNSNEVLSDNRFTGQHLFLESNTAFRNHSVINPLSILEEIIDGLVKNYRELERKEGKYIAYRLQKNRKLISDLYEVHDSLAFLKWYDVWVMVEANMDYLLKQDPSISGFMFRIRTKTIGENFVRLIWD